MKDEGHQTRFSYPGHQVNYLDGKPVYEARMFFGNCATGHPDAVIWFERGLGEDKKWHETFSLAEVTDDNLVYGEMGRGAPKLSELEDAVRTKECQEVPGRDSATEP
jgi:hypothetical protein